MTGFLPRVGVALLLSLLAGEAGAQSRQFDCGAGAFITLKVIDARTISAGPIDGRSFALKQDPDERMRFAAGRVVLEIARDQTKIRVASPDRDVFDCSFRAPARARSGDVAAIDAGEVIAPVARPKAKVGRAANRAQPARRDAEADGGEVSAPVVKPKRAAKQPAASGRGFAAKSWGGIVRSGPGMEFKKLASLTEGDRIAVIAATDVMMGEYPWFQIRYGDGKTGYQWGGIICPVGKEVAGAFQSCD